MSRAGHSHGRVGGMRILIGLAIIVALAYLGYRMFFVNAHKK